MADTAVFDVDGTLIDTNYHHALAWSRAFRVFGLGAPLWEIHRAIGMGGDQLVAAVLGQDAEFEHGDAVRGRWSAEYLHLLPEVRPLPGARELLVEVRRRGFRVVLASSSPQQHVDHYLDLLQARDLAEAWTTSDDVEASKPAPDLIGVAIEKVGGADAVMVGDSVWDVESAGRADVPTVCVRTGGFGVDELREAGAVGVYESPADLRERLDDSPLAAPDGRSTKG